MSLIVTFGGMSMIDSKQIRAARAFLDWTIDKLADGAGINRRTVIRIEKEDGRVAPSEKTLHAIRSAFESAGIEFIETDGGGKGVIFRDVK
jgi:DNA-binding XRE family transcriptional regulator